VGEDLGDDGRVFDGGWGSAGDHRSRHTGEDVYGVPLKAAHPHTKLRTKAGAMRACVTMLIDGMQRLATIRGGIMPHKQPTRSKPQVEASCGERQYKSERPIKRILSTRRRENPAFAEESVYSSYPSGPEAQQSVASPRRG
jgi:hypothetical protein